MNCKKANNPAKNKCLIFGLKSRMMDLYYRKMGEGQPLIILHGLFGSSDNWLSIGKHLSEHYEVHLVDQRNHGQSPHSDTFNYPDMAVDLKHFIERHEINSPMIIGHSMGGKVAMEYAVRNPNDWQKLIVVDIAPKAYPVHHDQILEGLNALDLSALKSRGDADAALAEYVPEKMVRQFLLKNLGRSPEGFEWKINLRAITDNIEIIGAQTSARLEENKPVLFVDGEHSGYIKDADHSLIHNFFPDAKISTIAGAGHWVHAEKPDEFLEVILAFLK